MLPPEGNPPDQIPVPYTALLIDAGPVRVLIDTSAGALGRDRETAGESRQGGLLARGYSHSDSVSRPSGPYRGFAALSDATVILMRQEFDFWTAPETQAKLQAGDMYGLGPLERLMAASVRDHLLPAKDRLRLIDQPTEVAGILVFPAPGHTPGHAAVLISSGRQQLLYVGDAIVNPAQFEHPDWVCAFDLARLNGPHSEEVVGPRRDRPVPSRGLSPSGLGRRREAWQSRFHWEPALV